MDDVYGYIDRDGDELDVRSVDYDGVPHAALAVLSTNGVYTSVHIPPEDAWEICEAILDAAGVDDDA
ncbi:hypothetical protein [Nonomuraea sp. KM90]|uniref:hypothetical protein n=1 Tax=Nonomuraea sp. KM90 TaxID=3457428 RepID=UPI003FCED122